jgi:phosphate transport system substrate-binding protein
MPRASSPTATILASTSYLVAAVIIAGAMPFASAIEVDQRLQSYKPVDGVAGNLNSVGSDTLNNLMTFWAEAFQHQYPNVKIQIEGKGSTTAPPALIEGTAQLGPMSREMKPTEIDAFEKKFGYKPTAFKVCIDALAVFVHKDNPITGLSLEQIDDIFSSTYKRGGRNIETWDAAGVAAWTGKPISLYGRNSASGTYGYFKEHSLAKGDYKATVKEQVGSSAVVQGVASDLNGIGYSGIGYLTSGVKALPIANKGSDFVEPTYENSVNGHYPLARYLYIYVNKKPDQALDTLTAEFLKFVESKEGQQIVLKEGSFPLPFGILVAMNAQTGAAK